MQTESLEFGDVRYNPEIGAFEAQVYIRDQEGAFAYPVRVYAALTAEFGFIARGLMQKAQIVHLSADPGLRLRRAAGAAMLEGVDEKTGAATTLHTQSPQRALAA